MGEYAGACDLLSGNDELQVTCKLEKGFAQLSLLQFAK
jgi:hypothetical protein